MESDPFASRFANEAAELMKPVWEAAVVVAAKYAKACGRDVFMAQDVAMGLMFATRRVLGVQTKSFFPHIYEPSAEEEDEPCDDDDVVWARYVGDDVEMLHVNEVADGWDAWEPQSPAEKALKTAVDKVRRANGTGGAHF